MATKKTEPLKEREGIDLAKMSVEQLQALAYQQMKLIQQAQSNLQAIEQAMAANGKISE